jgi:hypothetical protein
LKAKRDPVNIHDFEELKSRGQEQTSPKACLLDQVRVVYRQKHYSPKTEKAFVFWIRQFIPHDQKQHPKNMSQAGTSRLNNFVPSGLRVKKTIKPLEQRY